MSDPDDGRRFVEAVEQKSRRRIQGRREDEGVWFWLGMFGLVGWAIAVPTLLGVLVGWWLDEVWPQRFSWTLSLLAAGLILGCVNAWHWIKRESEHG